MRIKKSFISAIQITKHAIAMTINERLSQKRIVIKSIIYPFGSLMIISILSFATPTPRYSLLPS